MRESSGARSMPAVGMRACVGGRDRQRVSAGARASPSWSDVRHRPTRIHSLVIICVELMGGVEEVAG
jgi:hypothetical protein